MSDDPLVKVARDLTEIAALTAQLEDEAEHRYADRDMPGGDAMVMLAHVASLEAWQHRIDAAEDQHYADPDRIEYPDHIGDVDPTWEPPLQTLCFWSEGWRDLHGRVSDRRPTVASEAAFLRDVLGWAFDHESRWADFCEDMHAARLRLENVLRAGDRDVISEDVGCLHCGEQLRRRMTHLGIEDDWWCRGCHRHLVEAEYNLCVAEAARQELLG